MLAPTLLLAASVVLQQTAAAPQPPADGPTRIAPPRGGFTLDMPARPQEQVLRVATAAGDVETVLFTVQRKDNPVVFVASYTDLPPADPAPEPSRVLAAARDGALATAKGTLGREAEFQIAGYPGREFSFSIPGADDKAAAEAGRARLFLVRGRLYQVLVRGEPNRVNGPEGTAFLQSFRLLKAAPPQMTRANPNPPTTPRDGPTTAPASTRRNVDPRR